MKKSLKVGDRVKGFKFVSTSLLYYISDMSQYINIVGIVEDIYPSGIFDLTFPDGEYWTYPLNHPLAKPYKPFKYKLK